MKQFTITINKTTDNTYYVTAKTQQEAEVIALKIAENDPEFDNNKSPAYKVSEITVTETNISPSLLNLTEEQMKQVYRELKEQYDKEDIIHVLNEIFEKELEKIPEEFQELFWNNNYPEKLKEILNIYNEKAETDLGIWDNIRNAIGHIKMDRQDIILRANSLADCLKMSLEK